MNDSQRMKRLDKAQLRVLFQVPFFAPGVAKLPNKFDDSQPTACTQGTEIRWNREFLDSLKDAEIVTILCHEVCHCLLGHLWRFPNGGDAQLWNQATDHAVNNMLKDFSNEVVSKRLAEPFPFPEGTFCCDPAFKGMAEEAIYNKLAGGKPPGKQPGQQPQSGQGQSQSQDGDGDDDDDGQSQGKQPGKGKGKGKGKPQPGSGQGDGDGQPNESGNGSGDERKPFGEFEPVTGQDAKEQQTDWQNTLIQSCHAAKDRGTLPGNLQRILDNLLNPKVPWQELLRNFIREQATDDWNFMKPNRLYGDHEFILPSLDSERMSAVAFGIDTSGSIDDQLLREFKSEMQGCLDDMKPVKLVELCCDTRVTKEKEYHIGDTVDMDAPGGGGTALEQIFNRLDERQDNIKACVILTDLWTSFPKQPPEYPVIWIVWGGKNDAPFGTVINVGD